MFTSLLLPPHGETLSADIRPQALRFVDFRLAPDGQRCAAIAAARGPFVNDSRCIIELAIAASASTAVWRPARASRSGPSRRLELVTANSSKVVDDVEREPWSDRACRLQPPGRRGPRQHIGQFLQQRPAADELHVAALSDGLEQPMGRASPQQRGQGNVGVKNVPHPRPWVPRLPVAHAARPAQP